MAKVKETIYVITISELVKNNTDPVNTVTSDEFVSALEQVAQELAGEGVLVEVEKA